MSLLLMGGERAFESWLEIALRLALPSAVRLALPSDGVNLLQARPAVRGVAWKLTLTSSRKGKPFRTGERQSRDASQSI